MHWPCKNMSCHRRRGTSSKLLPGGVCIQLPPFALGNVHLHTLSVGRTSTRDMWLNVHQQQRVESGCATARMPLFLLSQVCDQLSAHACTTANKLQDARQSHGAAHPDGLGICLLSTSVCSCITAVRSGCQHRHFNAQAPQRSDLRRCIDAIAAERLLNVFVSDEEQMHQVSCRAGLACRHAWQIISSAASQNGHKRACTQLFGCSHCRRHLLQRWLQLDGLA